MSAIISDIRDDLQKLEELKVKIREVKQELVSFDIRVEVDRKNGLEKQLQSLSNEYQETLKRVSLSSSALVKALNSMSDAVDMAKPKKELHEFDEQLIKMCENLDSYFGGLQERLQSLLGILNNGDTIASNIKTNDENINKIEELRRKNEELTGLIRQRNEELEKERQIYRQLADAVKNNDTSFMQRLSQQPIDSGNLVKELKEINGLLDDELPALDKLQNKYDGLVRKVKKYENQLSELKSKEWYESGKGYETDITKKLEEARKQMQGAKEELDAQKTYTDELMVRQAKVNDLLNGTQERQKTIRAQILQAREGMVQFIAAGQKGTPMFYQLAEEAGKIRRQLALADATMSYFADQNRDMNTLKTGLQGVAGAAGMAAGVIGLFNSENEKTAQIQAKVQSILAIVVGLETTYNLVKKTSYVMMAIEEVKTWALAKARGVQAVATTAATEAQETLNTSMRSNPIGAIISLLAILGTAIYAVVKAFTSETEAEKKAREEKEKHTKSIAEQHKKWAESVASCASQQIMSYNELQRKWNELGNDLKTKKRFVKDNQAAFHELGFAVNGVSDAENILVKNTDAVVNAIMARAKAAAYEKIATENMEKQIREQLKQDTTTGDYKFNYKAGTRITREQLEKRYGVENLGSLLIGKDLLLKNGQYEFTKSGADKGNALEGVRVSNAQKEKSRRIENLQKENKKIQELVNEQLEIEKKAAKDAGVTLYNGEKDHSREEAKNAKEETDRKKKSYELQQHLSEEQLRQQQATRKAQEAARIALIQNAGERERETEEEQHRLNMESIDNREAEMKKKLYEYNKSVFENQNKGKAYSDTKDGKGGWAAVELTKDQQAELKALREKEETEYSRSVLERYKKEAQAMRDYLKEYGSYEQQRLAIAEEYAEKIKNARTEGEKLQLQKQQEQAQANLSLNNITGGIDWRAVFGGVENMTTQMMKTLSEQLKAWQKSPDYQNADAGTKQQVAQMLADMRQYLGSEMSVTWKTLASDIEKFNASVDTFKEAQEAEKPFVEAYEQARTKEEEAIKKLEELTQKLAKGDTNVAKDDVTAQQGTVNTLAAETKAAADVMKPYSEATVNAKKNMEAFGQQVNTTTDELKNKVPDWLAGLKNNDAWNGVEGYGNVTSSLDGFQNLSNNMGSVLAKMQDGTAKEMLSGLQSGVDSALGSIGGGLEGILSSGIGQVIGFVAQIPKMILQFADAIKNFVTGILDSVSELLRLDWLSDLVVSITDAIANLIDAILDLPESILTAIKKIVVDGIGGLLNNIIGRVTSIFGIKGGPADWLGFSDNTAKLQKEIEKLNNHSQTLSAAMKSLEDTFEKTTADQVGNIASDMKEVQEALMKNESEKMVNEAQKHGFWRASLNASVEDNKGWKSAMKEVSEILGYNVSKSAEFLRLSADEMKKVLDYDNGELLNRILNEYRSEGGSGGRSDQLPDMIMTYIENFAGKIEEITEKTREKITGTSFDSVYDSFMSSLNDLANGSEDVFDDIADNWQKMINKMVLENLVGSKYKQQLEGWYKQWEEYYSADNYLDKNEIKDLKEKYDKLVHDAADEVEALRKSGIVTATSDTATKDQSASAIAADKITYEQADEGIGILTAIQIATEQIRDKVGKTVIMATNDDIMRANTDLKDVSIGIRDIIAQSYLELQEIRGNTGAIIEPINKMQSDIAVMKRDIHDKL